MRRPSAALLVLVLAAAAPAAADTPREALEEARRLVNVELKFKQAIELLERTLSDPRVAREERVEAYRLMAIAYVARGANDSAEAAFAALLVLEPGFELDARLSPKIHEVYARAKSRVTIEARLTDVVALPADRQVSFSARLEDRGGRVARVQLYVRADGAEYAPVSMQRQGDSVIARVPSDGHLRLEYYLVATDAGGSPVARVAAADSPSSLVITQLAAPPPVVIAPVEPEAPIYTAWWFWALAIGVVGAGTAVAVVMATRGSTPPGLDPIQLD